MSGVELRLLVVAVLVVLVVGAALATRRWQRPAHATLAIPQGQFSAGLVVFTSTDCERCRDALAAAKGSRLPIREVTWELEPRTLEQLHVEAVPLVVAIDHEGAMVDQIVGVPSKRWLKRVGSAISAG